MPPVYKAPGEPRFYVRHLARELDRPQADPYVHPTDKGPVWVWHPTQPLSLAKALELRRVAQVVSGSSAIYLERA
jgi:hypothetical protein